ncbi:MAG: hypothetical protein Kow0090_06920 [Myxococcota bacterium]
MNKPLLYFFLLVIPAFLIFIGLIYHSYKHRGGRITALFFILGALFFIGRETMNALTPHYNGLPQYFFLNRAITIWKAPLPAVIGWLITAYLGWFLAERILANHPRLENRLFPTLLISGVFASAMALALEGVGIHLGWWNWAKLHIYYTEDPFREYLLDAPFVALWGWFLIVLTFLTPFFLAECSKFRRKGAIRYLWFLIVPINALLLTKFFYLSRVALIGALFVLAVLSPMEFDYPAHSSKEAKAKEP